MLGPGGAGAANARRPDLTGGAWSGPLLVYGALSVVAIGAAMARGLSPIGVPAGEAWLPLVETFGAFGDVVGHGLSMAGGAVLAIATIKATRHFVRRWGWARALHSGLRPTVKNAGSTTLFVVGISSALGEELFFRGMLTTTFGLVASSLAFGLLHQMRGRLRWVWAGWATVMGLLFGALFLATGSLLGALVAHAAINVTNLYFLRDTDMDVPKPRYLGGLLGRV